MEDENILAMSSPKLARLLQRLSGERGIQLLFDLLLS